MDDENDNPLEKEIKARNKKIEELKAKFRLEYEDKLYEFGADYNSHNLNHFIDIMCIVLADAEMNGNYYLKRENEFELEYFNAARIRLMDIQHRKLFDLQCRWRAEEITIPQIEISEDFYLFDSAIYSCPFLTPINDEEFEIYYAFLKSAEFNLDWYGNHMPYDWQDYKDFKEYYFYGNKSRGLQKPLPWYLYYEKHTGLDSLYLLEDKRGAKEKKYMDAARKHKGVYESFLPMYHVSDDRPRAEDTEKLGIEFAERYLDKETINRMKRRLRFEDISENTPLYNVVDTLLNADRKLAIESNADWRDALNNLEEKYQKEKILEQLPAVYRDYKMKLKLGLTPAPNEHDDLHYSIHINMVKEDKEYILLGREVLNEPKDFNF